MATTVRHSVSLYINSFRHKYKPYYPAIAVGVLGSVIIGRAAWNDYKVFLSYGPGGVPYNVFGWFVATLIRAFGINMFDVRDFEKSPDQRSWLGRSWPTKNRSGVRPTIGPHLIPQRQLDQHAPPEIQEKYQEAFNSLVAQNANIVQFKLSKYELHTDAVWVHDDCPVYTLGKDFTREVSHIHKNTDFSTHVILAPKDAMQVIRSGWGQLHGLAGVSLFGRKVLPKPYVLLYAPRTEEEVGILIEIVRAGIGFMTDSRELMSP
ncbi:uncharacterized protein Z518_04248 [Rhinocladiella mackenziei CBS 650.93]|uniref:Luciferase domain-containing protein n=1 Tax=Rhinocladiella mackenziei CBS 650.93 TaxID=1442369 RepID=A0A0D2H792_9EURO|nr:uncharacterized protein Z518_04248 [Rhinocladiella mackenziei CBS 650.93]KIX06273.1 hypothetical protein Z518_04248 [Rhinocladiella mackenziei CBS 650.93]